ncbi:hypothetical protein LTS17_007334 [Exophiala oligosperma]
MVRKKPLLIKAWPFTPEPSPRLEPAIYILDDISEEELDMSGEDVVRARPISMVSRREGLLSPGRPTLEDVLNNTAPSPYTLAAFTAFLSQQHCLETLEFTTEAKKYGEKPGSPREINLPAEERDALVRQRCEVRPPLPEKLDPAVRRMFDLMSESIFIPFCNSLKHLPYAQTYNAMSEYAGHGDLEPARLTFDERTMHRHASRRRRSPPNTSDASFQPSRSPPQQHNRTSTLSSALGRQSGNRLSTHVSHSSAVSESALTDSSGGPESPPPGEHDSSITPPTTPPTSDLGMASISHGSSGTSLHPSKSHRSESGSGWKKAMKLFGGGGKKKTGSFHEGE